MAVFSQTDTGKASMSDMFVEEPQKVILNSLSIDDMSVEHSCTRIKRRSACPHMRIESRIMTYVSASLFGSEFTCYIRMSSMRLGSSIGPFLCGRDLPWSN